MKLEVKVIFTFSSDTMKGVWLVVWLSFLLLVTPSEFSDVVGHEPVQVTAGDDVILLCHLEPPFDVTDLTVEWKLNDSTVHVYRHKKDVYDSQDEQFRNRTSLFPDELVKGNISLKLTNVTEDDSGVYFCYVPKLNSAVKKGNVLLRVNPQKDPGGGDKKTPDDKKPTKDDQTGVIVSCVIVLIIAVSAVMLFYIKRGRREKKKPGRLQTELTRPSKTVVSGRLEAELIVT